MIGGEHATALPEYCLDDSLDTNYVVLGEGEQTLVDLAAALEASTPLTEVNGLVLRDSNKFIHTSSRKRIRQIDRIPLPAWHLFPIEKYLDAQITFGVNLGRTMPMLASRGCPFQCTFCSNPVMYGTLWRPRSPADVLNEMLIYRDKYNVYSFDFYDLTAIVKRSWIKEFCNLIIEKKLGFSWQLPTGTRSEALDEEIIVLLRAAGCQYLVYAPESGSDKVLKMIKKKISLHSVRSSLRAAQKNQLGTKVNIIFGFPKETIKDIFISYKFIVQVAIIGVWDLSCFPFSPYPGSEIFNQLLKSNALSISDEYYNGLAQYTDPSKAVSYSENISSFALPIFCTLGIVIFYVVSFAVRPMRLYRTARNLSKGISATKLESAIMRLQRKAVLGGS